MEQISIFNPKEIFVEGEPLLNSRKRNGIANKLDPEDRPFHDWYRFVLSFPPHLVRQYFDRFKLGSKSLVLDPFCGTGTTVVESKKQGIPAFGIEAHPMPHFAATVKVDWSISSEELRCHAKGVAEKAHANLRRDKIEDNPLLNNYVTAKGLRALPEEAFELLLENSISPLPLHKTLVLLEAINSLRNSKYYRHELLALAKALVTVIGNLEFGPEVGVGPAKKDALVIGSWLNCISGMAYDLERIKRFKNSSVNIFLGDSRKPEFLIPGIKFDAVFTSPPYPNEKDYTRTTRLESVILGFIKTRNELKEIKQYLLRSNTRNVYRDDKDDQWLSQHSEIQQIADEIERRRKEMGKTSGFERQYHRVTKLYFGGMAQHLAGLRNILKPGAKLGYVVGDQASYLRVMIRTGHLLASIAEPLGYKVESIDLFRTRLATATRAQLREEIVVLRWPG